MAAPTAKTTMRPMKVLMDQVRSKSVLQTYNVNAKPQETFRLPGSHLFRALRFQLDGTYDTTASTLLPTPYDLANLIDNVVIKTSGNQVLFNLTGADLYDLFLRRRGISGDNKAIVGGSIQSAATARMTLELPFYHEDAKMSHDGLLETLQKDVDVTITWKNPAAVGVLFGTITGLANTAFTCKITSEEYVCTPDVAKYLVDNTTQRIMVGSDFPVTQTNDQFVVDKQTKVQGIMHKKWVVIPRSTSTNLLKPDATILDFSKKLSVNSTAGNTVIQDDLVQGYRSETLVRREDPSTTAGLIDVNFTADGSLMQSLPSTSTGELYLKTPVVTNANAPTLRLITDLWQANTSVNA